MGGKSDPMTPDDSGSCRVPRLVDPLPSLRASLPAPLAALWWDAKGDWARAHGMVDDLETPEGMAVHAYLHRKEGVEWNADYWYSARGAHFTGRRSKRSGRRWWRGWRGDRGF